MLWALRVFRGLLGFDRRCSDGVHCGECCEIPMVGTIMDTSIRCNPGESWPTISPIVDALREPVARAVRGYIYLIYPHRVPNFRRGTWLRRTTPDTEVPGSIPGDGISVYPVESDRQG